MSNLKAMIDLIVYGFEVVGVFVLSMLALYIIARVATLAYFKSKREHETSTTKDKV